MASSDLGVRVKSPVFNLWCMFPCQSSRHCPLALGLPVQTVSVFGGCGSVYLALGACEFAEGLGLDRGCPVMRSGYAGLRLPLVRSALCPQRRPSLGH